MGSSDGAVVALRVAWRRPDQGPSADVRADPPCR